MVIASWAAYRGSRPCTQVPLPRYPCSAPPSRTTARHPAGTGRSSAVSGPAVLGAGAVGSGGGGRVLVVVGSGGTDGRALPLVLLLGDPPGAAEVADGGVLPGAGVRRPRETVGPGPAAAARGQAGGADQQAGERRPAAP